MKRVYDLIDRLRAWADMNRDQPGAVALIREAADMLESLQEDLINRTDREESE